MKRKLLIVLMIITISCNSQEKKAKTIYSENTTEQNKALQIGQYVVNTFQDSKGNLWFGTGASLSKYDGKTFSNYSEKDGLCSNMISNLYMDSKGIFWIGTWGGVCTFNGTQFEEFSIPYPKISTKINPDTKNWITEITEDAEGNIWFGRDAYGASKFDGHSFTHFTKKEGLNSNNVQSIVEDAEGNIWIGTRVAEKDNVILINELVTVV
ncbi:two-component regulator propeller domain-containing protein [Kordia sp.]|uniref:ligand-binding sensor domain-containing protein n=1 Tax=Kordia sp. TaxID=1965332 RepID=UPI0025C273A3|nr:two-component regulator propeller domain-containing protein [Kordia sp.]MCH2194262.1 hypothetical protein [Kordia sp.]